MYNTYMDSPSPCTQGEMRMVIDNVYEMNGYADRQEYLDDLADNMGIDRSIVSALADMLGETEDFDGLVTSLEDFGGYDD
jgi:hypothetical protein